MTSKLVEALERLHIEDEAAPAFLQAGNIDDVLFQPKPRKRQRADPDELKAKLEKRYLTPPTALEGEWLNRLQQ
jgi:antiviral helicase SKI2